MRIRIKFFLSELFGGVIVGGGVLLLFIELIVLEVLIDGWAVSLDVEGGWVIGGGASDCVVGWLLLAEQLVVVVGGNEPLPDVFNVVVEVVVISFCWVVTHIRYR